MMSNLIWIDEYKRVVNGCEQSVRNHWRRKPRRRRCPITPDLFGLH